MSIPQQLLIVFLILATLSLVITLLYKLHLFPLAIYFVATDLFFPKWAGNHQVLCFCLLVSGILYAMFRWFLRIRAWRQEQRYYENFLLEIATPLYNSDCDFESSANN